MAAEDAADKKPFHTLHTLLATARELVQELSDDPEVERLVRAFRLFPPRDRETIVEVIEKDAAWRRIVERTEAATGIDVRPNPHASLYVHVLDRAGLPAALQPPARDADVIRLGVQTFVDLIPLFFQDGVYAQWTTAAREVAAAATPERRAEAMQLVREVERIIAEAGERGAR